MVYNFSGEDELVMMCLNINGIVVLRFSNQQVFALVQ